MPNYQHKHTHTRREKSSLYTCLPSGKFNEWLRILAVHGAEPQQNDCRAWGIKINCSRGVITQCGGGYRHVGSVLCCGCDTAPVHQCTLWFERCFTVEQQNMIHYFKNIENKVWRWYIVLSWCSFKTCQRDLEMWSWYMPGSEVILWHHKGLTSRPRSPLTGWRLVED